MPLASARWVYVKAALAFGAPLSERSRTGIRYYVIVIWRVTLGLFSPFTCINEPVCIIKRRRNTLTLVGALRCAHRAMRESKCNNRRRFPLQFSPLHQSLTQARRHAQRILCNRCRDGRKSVFLGLPAAVIIAWTLSVCVCEWVRGRTRSSTQCARALRGKTVF